MRRRNSIRRNYAFNDLDRKEAEEMIRNIFDTEEVNFTLGLDRFIINHAFLHGTSRELNESVIDHVVKYILDELGY